MTRLREGRGFRPNPPCTARGSWSIVPAAINSPAEPMPTTPDPTRAPVWDEFWSGKSHVGEVYPAVSDLVTELRRAIPSAAGQRLLEVGAGTGREGHTFAAEGTRVVLLDISTEALRLSRQVSARPWFLQGNALGTPFADETFDVVYHQGLLEHFRDPLPLLRENHRILRRGGHLVVDVPQRYHVYTLMKHALMTVGKWFGGWETEFSPQQLERVVSAAGFEIVHRFGYAMHPGLTYRLVREAGKKVGWRLPLYPRFGPLDPLCRGWHRWLRRWEQRRGAHWFTVTVGVLARKP